MPRKILVTGSSGVIGTRICERLLEQGFDIECLDWKKNKWNKEIDELTIISDIRKQDFFEKISGDIDLIIHLAANSRVYDLIENPSLALDNIKTLYNILEYSRLNKIKKLIFASSREVYGDIDKAKATEVDANVVHCESPYSASKFGGEALICSYGKSFNLDFLILRFSNVYGMYDESNRVIPLFIRLCKERKEINIFGDTKVLDFVHINDAIDALTLAVDKFNLVKNDIFNIASGEGTSIKKLADQIKFKMNTDVKIKTKKNRTGEVMKFIGDISKASDKLGYYPKVGLDEGLSMAIAWYSNNK